MTTFQRLVQRGFEEGTDHGIELQQIATIKKLHAIRMNLEQIAQIVDVDLNFVKKNINQRA